MKPILSHSLFFILLAGFPLFSNSRCIAPVFEHLKAPEGGFCFECAEQKTTSSLLIPTRSCFEKSIRSRGKPKYSYNTFCANGYLPNMIKNRKAMCIEKEYIDMTAQAFHEVTRCLDIKNLDFFFALLNRESRFQITARSNTGASCYGQLTGTAVEEINQHLARGPFKVKDLSLCQPIMKNWQKLDENYGSRTRQSVCAAHSNPYSCLFYSASYYQMALEEAQKVVKESNIITLKLKNKKDTMIFKNEREFNNYLSENKLKTEDIKEKKTFSLFHDKEIVAQTIALKGYNGGPETVRRLFKQYTNNIKSHLWSQTKTGQAYKQEIFSKKPFGITSSDFIHTFRTFVGTRYRWQTGNFVKDILNDFNQVTGSKKSCGNISARDLITTTGRFTAQNI